jgi:K+-transporting ATPase c subunit
LVTSPNCNTNVLKEAFYLQQLGQQAQHKTQQQGAGEGDVPLSAKKFEVKIAGQFTQAHFFHPRPHPADQQQRQKNHNEPAHHN